MAFQPNEKSAPKNDDETLDKIGNGLMEFINFQADIGVVNSAGNDDAVSPIQELLVMENLDEILKETTPFDHGTDFDEPLFPEGTLGESELMDTSSEPINEVTGTTTSSEVGNGGLPSSLNVVPDATETTTEAETEKINLKSVDSDIQKTLMTVIVQPTKDPRRRYGSEGKRRMKKLQSDLLTLAISKLQRYTLNENQRLWLRLALITHSDDPYAPIHIHPDKLVDLSKKARKLDDGSICFLVTQSMIDQGIIELKDLTIIKTRDREYTFQLIPYSTSEIDDTSEPYVVDDKKKTVGNAKIFRIKYNVKASRIACQLLIEEDEEWYFTDITCSTDVMIEQKYEPEGRKSNKRLGKNKRKTGKKRRSTIKSKSIQRKKCFN